MNINLDGLASRSLICRDVISVGARLIASLVVCEETGLIS